MSVGNEEPIKQPRGKHLSTPTIRRNHKKDYFFAVQNLKMALKKANILQHTKSFFV